MKKQLCAMILGLSLTLPLYAETTEEAVPEVIDVEMSSQDLLHPDYYYVCHAVDHHMQHYSGEGETRHEAQHHALDHCESVNNGHGHCHVTHCYRYFRR